MDKVSLLIILDNRTITIPFKNIKSLDTFTEAYQDKEELVDMLNRILNLEINNNKIHDCLVLYPQKNNKHYITGNIKYQSDIFDMNKITILYTEYVLKHYKEIIENNYGFKKVMENYQNKLGIMKELSEKDLEKITKLYLEGSYRRYRDAYFLLKPHNNKKVTIDNINKSITNIKSNDEFISYLSEYSQKGEEEYIKSLDLLASYDLEELREKGVDYPFIDGLYQKTPKKPTKEDIIDEAYVLEDMTGKSIDELNDKIVSKRRF